MHPVPLILTPDILLAAYCQGAFPMGQGRHDPKLIWLSPESRGILPLDGFHVGRSLRKLLRQNPFRITVNTAFTEIMQACAAPAPDRDDTWITPQIIQLYTALHHRGFAHSIECWDQWGLAGGLYGVAIGGAFCGESMVSLRSGASKVALTHLVARLRAGGFSLLDTQFTTPHLHSLGGVEIPRDTYLDHLARAVRQKADFFPLETRITENLVHICH